MESQSKINYVLGQLSDNNSPISSNAHSTSSNQNSSNHSASITEIIQNQSSNVKFLWRDKGQLVYLTGSFCNWKEKFLLQNTPEGYEITLNLPVGTHQYKFIVDGEWKFATHAPTINEQGIINNIIEIKPKPIKPVIQPQDKKSNDFTNDREILIEKPAYPCYVEYKRKYNMNSSNTFRFNHSYGELRVLPHVYTNHLFIRDKTFDNPSLHSFSYIRKIRKKYVTLTYYTVTKR